MDIDSVFDILEDEKKQEDAINLNAPLARRMRPSTIDEIIGQDEALGKDSWLRCAISANILSSIILYGPSGVGKTATAYAIANSSDCSLEEVSAISGSVADIRKVITNAKSKLLNSGIKTILFVDEIHRFSKSQQDSLLHAVEDRDVILIGATTENPYFEINNALLSRSRIVMLNPLSDESINAILERALISKKGLDGKFKLDHAGYAEIVNKSDGDARKALNILEFSSQVAAQDNRDTIKSKDVEIACPHRQLNYDRNKDMHYDIISAFIKSMRGSDPDAALYWMARMLAGGEDPKFIARRILICASEDVGNADPMAINVAASAFYATTVIGMPECQINLAQACTYVALAKKSNACVMGIETASQLVKNCPQYDVPNYLRDRHRPGSDDYGDYLYPHEFSDSYVEQQYLPDELKDTQIYKSGKFGFENESYKRIMKLKNKE